MANVPNWPVEFARVTNCSLSTTSQCPTLLRDDQENIPQPGYIGLGYRTTRLLLNLEAQLTASTQELSAVNQRKATLESEVPGRLGCAAVGAARDQDPARGEGG
jgi:hypothetical protein